MEGGVTVRILRGHVLDRLRELPDESVHCCVTSPPYYGLRDYGVAGQLGLEPTLAEYLDNMVAVFREVRRVLRSDGTLWLNIGDSYATGAGAVGNCPGGGAQGEKWAGAMTSPNRMPQAGYKPKDLMGVPWRLAFALQADGWWLRQDIIWYKPNPMPESVRDRCTKAHEYIFLLTKSERYYFDQAANSEPATSAYDPDSCKSPDGWASHEGGHGSFHREGREKGRSGNKARKPASDRGVPIDTNGSASGAVAGSVPWEGATRNRRSVWTITTQAFPEAHFATFPTEIPRRAIVAGCPAGGTVLDPFLGSGTTALVADRLQRDCIGIELNPAYADMAERRIRGDAPLFAEVA